MRRMTIAVGVVVMASIAPAQNLLNNPGFETGDTSGWSITAASSNSFFYVDNFGNARTGADCLGLGAWSSIEDTFFQNVATTIGSHYTYSMWVNGSNNSDQDLTIKWGSTTLFHGVATRGYTQYSYDVTATATTTKVSFGGYNNSDINYADDISLTATPAPEPASMAILGIGVASILRRRRRIK